jgi:aryl-phospho-beta-D-glucosidase BglC (GH1 family)
VCTSTSKQAPTLLRAASLAKLPAAHRITMPASSDVGSSTESSSDDDDDVDSVDWQPLKSQNFSTPFEVKAALGKLWIRAEWQDSGSWEELRLNGVNWAGFQSSGCPHELWKHNVTEYIDFISAHGFNAVRLPLSAPIVVWALYSHRRA